MKIGFPKANIGSFSFAAFSRRARRAFTLTDTIVSLGIAGVVGGLAVQGAAKATQQSKGAQAKKEIKELVAAIEQYQTTYGRLPASPAATHPTINCVPVPPRDFTYGTVSQNGVAPLVNASGQALPLVRSQDSSLARLDHQANNSEIMSVLMDIEFYDTAGTRKTVNYGHALNPQRIVFLTPKRSTGNTSSGVGDDLVYRDPWGNPYIVTLDLDYDGRTWDSFYAFAHVSERNAPQDDKTRGLVGLERNTTAPYDFPATDHPSSRHDFASRQSVMVWSFGRDGAIDFNLANSEEGKANEGKNKDNVLSW